MGLEAACGFFGNPRQLQIGVIGQHAVIDGELAPQISIGLIVDLVPQRLEQSEIGRQPLGQLGPACSTRLALGSAYFQRTGLQRGIRPCGVVRFEQRLERFAEIARRLELGLHFLRMGGRRCRHRGDTAERERHCKHGLAEKCARFAQIGRNHVKQSLGW